jgi:hypothetical protein
MRRTIYIGLFILVLAGMVIGNSGLALAEEQINEDELFSGDGGVVEESDAVKENVDEELRQRQFSLSGEIQTVSAYSVATPAKNWLGMEGDTEELRNTISAAFYLDARFAHGVKSFANLELTGYPEGLAGVQNQDWGGEKMDENTTYLLKELFLDANIGNKIYFRGGKQVLKWGRSYFWNPTDLINIDRKDFFDMDESREGTVGLKVHVPSGVKRNVYMFVGSDDPSRLDEASLALKYEFLVNNTEMSFSAWNKQDYHPVYGYDISTRWGDFDIRGEVSLAEQDNAPLLDYETLEPATAEEWVPRLSFGFTKEFDVGDIKDRISLTGEFYYNGAGYDRNIFQRIEDVDPAKKTEYMKVYQPYLNSKYYMAVFSSVKKFIKPEYTLNLNGIFNLVDHSATLTSGIGYKPTLKDIYVDFDIYNFLGDRYTEATFLGQTWKAALKIRVLF